MSDNHYDVISNITGFTCVNEDRHKAEYSKCKACKNKTKCDVTKPQVQCKKCYKSYYGKICFDNHIRDKKCKEHSYVCNQCHRFYKTNDLPMDEHRCDEIKCGNCKKYVKEDHRCYMLRKDVKPRSEKYVFLTLKLN